MTTPQLIPIQDFCRYYHVEVTFIERLADKGLIQTRYVAPNHYLLPDQLTLLEKLVRLHHDLNIHPDDLDVIAHLMDQMETLQQQVLSLQNRLRFYER